MNINFDFLSEGKKYEATIYRNSDDADYLDNPTGYVIEKMNVDSGTNLNIKLVPGGGAAISVYQVE